MAADGVIIVNFAHPLTDAQRVQVEALVGQPVARMLHVPAHVDAEREMAPQAIEMVDRVPLSAEEWQSGSLLVNPPGLASLTAVLLAELHGRIGHFPALLRIRRTDGVTPSRYEVAEVLDLQVVRDWARGRRQG